MQALLLKLEDFRKEDQYFDKIFENISLNQSEAKRRKISDIEDPRLRYKQIYNEILDTVINQIKTRFSEITKLNFFDSLKKIILKSDISYLNSRYRYLLHYSWY